MLDELVASRLTNDAMRHTTTPTQDDNGQSDGEREREREIRRRRVDSLQEGLAWEALATRGDLQGGDRAWYSLVSCAE